ncbi:hypothetical protein GQ53DRAFT_870596 [Thozetella sp. PMI_491]|nr:hypothetical protein GQ53DRAFT_870596 [Thozetella sp. PMI_491]
MSTSVNYLPNTFPTLPQVSLGQAEVAGFQKTAALLGPVATILGGFVLLEAKLDLTSLIDYALASEKYDEALFLLSSMRVFGHKVDMTVRWRWIRDYGTDSGYSRRNREITAEQKNRLTILIAMLRLVGPADPSLQISPRGTPSIVEADKWDLRNIGNTDTNAHIAQPTESLFPAREERWLKSQFRIIRDIPGDQLERTNVSPARYYTSKDDVIRLSAVAPSTTHHAHPVVPNLHCLKDVFRSEECTEIISAAETVGFLPDIPTGPVPEKGTTCGLYFYWVLDEAFYSKLWARVEQFIPQTFNNKKLRGLNRWFRVYRYILGQQYAAHIDGAWPPSGIDPVTDTYVEDASPVGAKQRSMLTFLVYLNDDFSGAGGETTFFLPNATIDGQMHAYSVQPTKGSVVLFPHGEIEQALYHQGTTVSGAGNEHPKYVIRSEVIYDA